MEVTIKFSVEDRNLDHNISPFTNLRNVSYYLTPKRYVCFIQGVSRLYGITAGGDFLGLCDEKSSYKNVSDFGRLRSYRRFLIPVHALVWTAVTAGGSYSASLVAAVISTLGRCGGLVFAWRFTTQRQPMLRPAVAFSKISFKHR